MAQRGDADSDHEPAISAEAHGQRVGAQAARSDGPMPSDGAHANGTGARASAQSDSSRRLDGPRRPHGLARSHGPSQSDCAHLTDGHRLHDDHWQDGRDHYGLQDQCDSQQDRYRHRDDGSGYGKLEGELKMGHVDEDHCLRAQVEQGQGWRERHQVEDNNLKKWQEQGLWSASDALNQAAGAGLILQPVPTGAGALVSGWSLDHKRLIGAGARAFNGWQESAGGQEAWQKLPVGKRQEGTGGQEARQQQVGSRQEESGGQEARQEGTGGNEGTSGQEWRWQYTGRQESRPVAKALSESTAKGMGRNASRSLQFESEPHAPAGCETGGLREKGGGGGGQADHRKGRCRCGRAWTSLGPGSKPVCSRCAAMVGGQLDPHVLTKKLLSVKDAATRLDYAARFDHKVALGDALVAPDQDGDDQFTAASMDALPSGHSFPSSDPFPPNADQTTCREETSSWTAGTAADLCTSTSSSSPGASSSSSARNDRPCLDQTGSTEPHLEGPLLLPTAVERYCPRSDSGADWSPRGLVLASHEPAARATDGLPVDGLTGSGSTSTSGGASQLGLAASPDLAVAPGTSGSGMAGGWRRFLGPVANGRPDGGLPPCGGQRQT